MYVYIYIYIYIHTHVMGMNITAQGGLEGRRTAGVVGATQLDPTPSDYT